MPISPRRVYGVASSARPDAGNRIWICRATPGAGGLRVEAVQSLAAMPGGAVERREAYRVLVSKILEVPSSAWGFDVPFSLPAAALQPAPPPAAASSYWTDLLERAGTPGDRFDAATAMVAAAVATVSAQRLADWVHVARGVLVPARAQGPVAVLPLDPLPLLPEGTPSAMRARAPSIYLLQVEPLRLLVKLEASSGGMVGVETATPELRRQRLRELVSAGQLRPLARSLRTTIATVDAGAGLLAVLAAVAVWRGYRTYDHAKLHVDPLHGNEGFAYC